MESKQQMYAFESQGTVFEAKVFGKEMHRRKKKKKTFKERRTRTPGDKMPCPFSALGQSLGVVWSVQLGTESWARQMGQGAGLALAPTTARDCVSAHSMANRQFMRMMFCHSSS